MKDNKSFATSCNENQKSNVRTRRKTKTEENKRAQLGESIDTAMDSRHHREGIGCCNGVVYRTDAASRSIYSLVNAVNSLSAQKKAIMRIKMIRMDVNRYLIRSV